MKKLIIIVMVSFLPLIAHADPSDQVCNFLCWQLADPDSDGIANMFDNCPSVANPDQADTDSDDSGNVCDNCPSIANPDQGDSDRDGIGDVCEDTDGDGVLDREDNCPLVPNGDCDANPNNCDIDKDGYVSDDELLRGGQQSDILGGEPLGNACDDQDQDGFADYIDKCPAVYADDGVNDIYWCVRTPQPSPPRTSTITPNPQRQVPGADSDYISDADDNCPSEYNPTQADADSDGLGDTCDNCPFVANPDQKDSDSDAIGDACVQDADGDGVMDYKDNCPLAANPGQEDSNGNERGDVCEVTVTASTTSPPPVGGGVNPFSQGSNSGCSMVADNRNASTLDLGTIGLVIAGIFFVAIRRKKI